MLTIDVHPFDLNMVTVSFNYSDYYLTRMRKLPARFEPSMRKWVMSKYSLNSFEELFAGEYYYKTPRWVILNEPKPDYKHMYVLKNSYPVPTMNFKPYDYQSYGINFMIDKLLKHKFVINADDVGLGKTIQAIGASKYFEDNHGIKRILVICKKSLKPQWDFESFMKFLSKPSLIVNGTPSKRKKTYKEFETLSSGLVPNPVNVLIVNYQTVLSDYSLLKAMGFDFVIIDEVHNVKARTGKMNGAICEIIASSNPYVVLLTGTPIQSKPDDIFGVVQIANPKYFGPWKKFKTDHIVEEYQNGFLKTIGYRNLDTLRSKVQDIIIRRTEHEVDVELPEVIPDVFYCTKDTVQQAIDDKIKELTLGYMGTIDKYEQFKKQGRDVSSLQIQYDQANAMLKGLIAAKQACANDPRLFFKSKSKFMLKEFSPLIPKNYTMSNKTSVIIDIVDDIIMAGHKLIVFTKFERQASLIAEEIHSAIKCNTLLYTGEINDHDREQALKLFKMDDDYPILIGTDAMNEGLNLQIAKYVIHMDQPDTPAIKTQRNGRTRRTNSTHQTVYSYDLLTNDSKDIERFENLKKLQQLFDGVVSLDSAQSDAIVDAMKQYNFANAQS